MLWLSWGFDNSNNNNNNNQTNNDTVDWFESYLTRRSQCVQVESKISDSLPVPWGVPQGSILGPLLFLVFINELAEVVTKDDAEVNDVEGCGDADQDAEVIIYADDNTPTTADKDPEQLQRKVQCEADLITGWFSSNKMVCSGDKTKLMIIGTGANRAEKLERPGKVLQVVSPLFPSVLDPLLYKLLFIFFGIYEN